MAKFSFRLQRVFDYKNLLRREQARTLAMRNKEFHDAEERLQEILSAQDMVQHPDEQIVRMADISLAGDYQKGLREALINQRLCILEAAAAVDAAREAYVERAKETEVLEALKQKQRERFQEEQTHAEKKKVDQVVIQRYRQAKPGIDDGGNDA